MAKLRLLRLGEEEWERHRECTPLAFLLSRHDCAAVPNGDLPAAVQADPGPADLACDGVRCAVERREQHLQRVRRSPDPSTALGHVLFCRYVRVRPHSIELAE
jgi:hypothetical protein